MNVLLTGASGFIGRIVLNSLLENGHAVTVVVRKEMTDIPTNCRQIVMDVRDFNSIDKTLVANVDVVVYLAAKVHQKAKYSNKISDEYYSINCESTLNIARVVSALGVKRFIFMSSIVVNGSVSHKPFTEEDVANPLTPYAYSKYQAEKGLLTISSQTGLEVLIIRSPLVYGENAPANFATLIKWVKKGFVLPFGAIRNKRSFISVHNLADFILLCVDRTKSPITGGEVFLVSDGVDVSTSELLYKVKVAYASNTRLISVPMKPMVWAAKVLGMRNIADNLFENMQVDSSKAIKQMGWKPPVSMDEQLRLMAQYDSKKERYD